MRARTVASLSTLLLVLVFVTPVSANPQARGVVYNDANTNGVRDAEEAGVPDVCVSNGRDVVKTDAKGEYTLPVTDDTILFVIKPTGWMTAIDRYNVPRGYYIHRPEGAPTGHQYKGVEPTGPLPASVDFPLHKQVEPERFEALLFGDTQVTDSTELEYLNRDIIAPLGGSAAAFVMPLGDLANNKLEMHQPLMQSLAQLGKPVYYVAGNHDMDQGVEGEELSDDAYQGVFGPTYYAFNYSGVHFIVLEDIDWMGPPPKDPNAPKRGWYMSGLGEKQLEFVRNDLKHVPAEQLIVLTMHIPIDEIKERKALFALLAERPHTVSFSGHTHFYRHWFFGEQEGWTGKEPHHHTTVGATCGSWWHGLSDEAGVPHTTCRDGTPNGYNVATFEKGTLKTVTFRAARRPADDQMNIHAPDALTTGALGSAEVLVNVFAGSEKSTVEMQVDGGEWTALERVVRADPQYAATVAYEEQLKFPRKLPKAELCSHLWRGALPEGLTFGTHRIDVRTTDVYGQKYESRRVIRVNAPEDAAK